MEAMDRPTVLHIIYLTKVENHLLDYPALSCNDVSAWTSTVVARECHLGPQRVQHIIKLYCMVSVQQANLSECKGRKNFCIGAILCSSLSHLHI